MNNPIRHIAGPYEDGVQQCVRCLEILADHRKTRDHHGFFNEGPVCCTNNLWHQEIKHDHDAVDCVPMGEGL